MARLPLWHAVGVCCLLLLLLATTTGASAQFVLPGQAPSSDEAGETQQESEPSDQVRELLSLLADPEVRDWLQDRLSQDPAMTAAGEPFNFNAWLRERLDRVRLRAMALAQGMAALPEEFQRASIIWSLEMTGADTLRSLLWVAIFLAVGCLAEAAFWRGTRDLRQRIVDAPANRLSVRLARTGLRFLVHALAVGVFALGTLGTFLLFDWQPIVRLFVLTFLFAFVITALVDIVAIFFLAPHAPTLRLLPLDTPTARYVRRWIIAVTVVAVSGVLMIEALEELGFFPLSRSVLASAVALLVAAMLIVMIWQNRNRAARSIGGGAGDDAKAERLRASLARLWPFFATAYVLVVVGLWIVGAAGLMWTLLIVLALPAADRLARPIVRGLLSAPEESVEPANTGPDDEHPMTRVVLRSIRAVLTLLALVALAYVWGIDVLGLTPEPSRTGRIAERAFEIALVLIIADLVWQITRTAIDRKLADMAADTAAPMESGEGGGAAGPYARLQTLLPLIRNFFAVVLLVIVGLILLSSLGVDIGPLLAGAGVVGLAIGFGAQALVRDIVSGVFFLIDDAFRLGEYMQIGDQFGTVEGISLRSLKLRHHRGQVHTIPFGEVRSMTNYSRDWVIVKLEFRVPFDTDLRLVKKLVKRIGQELMDDPILGQSFIEPLKSQGVRRWEEFNMVVGVKFMSKPGQQFLIRREAYQRVRDTFEEHGIHFARRDVTVRVSPDATPEEVEQAAAAAAQPLVDTPAAPESPQGKGAAAS